MIREMMETFGVDRLQAAFMVAQHLGGTDCDVHETSALSEQERRAIGLGISLEEAIRRVPRTVPSIRGGQAEWAHRFPISHSGCIAKSGQIWVS